ncbi:MAG: CoA-binding protein [Nitrososphaeria archaeon]
MQELEYLFNPRSIAVIGASSKPGKIGHECLKSLLRSGYKGYVYPINPNIDKVLGLVAYPDIGAIPNEVDLVIYVLPAEDSVRIFQNFKTKNVKAVIIISSGFREFSSDGVQIEEKIIEVARQSGFKIIGPNCVGVYDSKSKVDSLFQSHERLPRPKEGNIAVISQSGTFAVSFMDWASEDGVGVSKVVSIGNRADVDEADLINYLRHDLSTRVISLYIESFTDGRKLINAIKGCGKPVVLYLASKTCKGASVAKSHTGRMASDYRIAESVLSSVGAILTQSFQQFYDVTKAISLLGKVTGDRVMMIANGVGPSVTAADLLEENGLKLAELSEETFESLRRVLPKYVVINNPLDLTGSATTNDFITSIKIINSSQDSDLIVLFVVFQDTPLGDDFAERLVTTEREKPIFVFAAGGKYTRDKCRLLNSSGIPCFQSVENLICSINALLR